MSTLSDQPVLPAVDRPATSAPEVQPCGIAVPGACFLVLGFVALWKGWNALPSLVETPVNQEPLLLWHTVLLCCLAALYLGFCRDAFLRRSLWLGFGGSLALLLPVFAVFVHSARVPGFWEKWSAWPELTAVPLWYGIPSGIILLVLVAWWLETPPDNPPIAVLGGLIAGSIPYLLLAMFVGQAASFHPFQAWLGSLPSTRIELLCPWVGNGVLGFVLLAVVSLVLPLGLAILAFLRTSVDPTAATLPSAAEGIDGAVPLLALSLIALFHANLSAVLSVSVLVATARSLAGIAETTRHLFLLPLEAWIPLALLPAAIANTLVVFLWDWVRDARSPVARMLLLAGCAFLAIATGAMALVDPGQRAWLLYHGLLLATALVRLRGVLLPPRSGDGPQPSGREATFELRRSLPQAVRWAFWGFPLMGLMMGAPLIALSLAIGLSAVPAIGPMTVGAAVSALDQGWQTLQIWDVWLLVILVVHGLNGALGLGLGLILDVGFGGSPRAAPEPRV